MPHLLRRGDATPDQQDKSISSNTLKFTRNANITLRSSVVDEKRTTQHQSASRYKTSSRALIPCKYTNSSSFEQGNNSVTREQLLESVGLIVDQAKNKQVAIAVGPV